MIDRRRIILLWFAWIVFFPLILWISYNHYYLNIENNFMDLLLFGSFMVLVALFPLKVNNYQLFFTNGISIVVFLMFGLFAEIILTQIIVILVLLNTGVRLNELYRFPLNMLSISIVSLLSAEVFYLFGGSHGGDNYQTIVQLFAAVMYGLSVIILNTTFNRIIDRYFYKREFILLGKEGIWEFTTLLLVLPVGYVLYILYTEIGTAGIFYLGVPFVFISIIIQLLYSYQELNDYLSKTSKIGHLLTKNLLEEQVYDIFLEELQSLIQTDYIRVFIEEKGELKLKRFYNSNPKISTEIKTLEKYHGFSKIVWEKKKAIIYRNRKNWQWNEDLKHKDYYDVQSVVSLPIEYGDELIGILTVASHQKNKFENFHMEILDILTSYLGVAIENAKNLEETKLESHTDGLTELYNFKYLENIIESHEAKSRLTENSKDFSIILLDIDHFKQVNDKYGHEAGNEVLKQLAQIIQTIAGDLGTVARYGGEEFVIFLPTYKSEKAYQLAKCIQKEVRNYKFLCREHILDEREPIEISITISIGIASYPKDCESLVELIRYADRAMYLGAKNKGRNRIALYGEIF